jgi:hypothetical protein
MTILFRGIFSLILLAIIVFFGNYEHFVPMAQKKQSVKADLVMITGFGKQLSRSFRFPICPLYIGKNSS